MDHRYDPVTAEKRERSESSIGFHECAQTHIRSVALAGGACIIIVKKRFRKKLANTVISCCKGPANILSTGDFPTLIAMLFLPHVILDSCMFTVEHQIIALADEETSEANQSVLCQHFVPHLPKQAPRAIALASSQVIQHRTMRCLCLSFPK